MLDIILGAVVIVVGIVVLLSLKFHTKAPVASTTSRDDPALNQQILKSDFILSAMSDGVMVINTNQVIITLNEAAAAITGWSRNEALGLNYHSVMKLLDASGAPQTNNQDVIAHSLQEGRSLRSEEGTLLSRDEKKVSVSLSVSPLVNNQRQVTAAVVVFRDVGQQRQAQQQRSDFISTASHEMRTPVAAIQGYLELALNNKMGSVDDRARTYLEKANASTYSLGKLFQDLLTSSRAEDGRLISHPTIIEMGDYLKKLVEELEMVATKKKLKVDFVVGSGEVVEESGGNAYPVESRRVVRPLYYVDADPERLREVITNLFDNAVKYTQQGGITVSLTGDNQVVQFSIKDSGPGIPAEDIPHLFQKFYRVDSSDTQLVNGTGLGLFISRKIIELYNGRIWIESKLGQGSTFYINLPRVSSQKAGAQRFVSAPPSVPKTATAIAAHS